MSMQPPTVANSKRPSQRPQRNAPASVGQMSSRLSARLGLVQRPTSPRREPGAVQSQSRPAARLGLLHPSRPPPERALDWTHTVGVHPLAWFLLAGTWDKGAGTVVARTACCCFCEALESCMRARMNVLRDYFTFAECARGSIWAFLPGLVVGNPCPQRRRRRAWALPRQSVLQLHPH